MGAGSTYSFISGETALPGSGAPFSFARGALPVPGSGSTYSFERGTPVGERGIRNEQIQLATLTGDRFTDTPIEMVASIYGLDLAQSGVTNIYTVPTGVFAVVVGVIIEAIEASAVTVVPSVSIGIVAGETDIFDTEALQDFDTLGDTWSNWLSFSTGRAAAESEVIKINVTAATATQLLGNVHLIGFTL